MKQIYTNIIIFVIIIIIIYITNIIFNITLQALSIKPTISNSLLLIWDIHCKLNVMNYLNNNNISYKLIEISDIGFIFVVNTNYYCFMSKHPQEYSQINILLNEIISIIKNNNLKSIISFSTGGSQQYAVGSVVQFTSAIIENPEQYSLNFNYIKSNNVLFKTDKYINKPIIDTKGFVSPSKGQIASGEDEFVAYIVSNNMNIPALTLTGISDDGISDNANVKEYDNGGGKLAAINTIDFFFETFQVL